VRLPYRWSVSHPSDGRSAAPPTGWRETGRKAQSSPCWRRSALRNSSSKPMHRRNWSNSKRSADGTGGRSSRRAAGQPCRAPMVRTRRLLRLARNGLPASCRSSRRKADDTGMGCDLHRPADRVFFSKTMMKYLVPPIVIPILLLIGIAAYAMLGPPIVAVGHPSAPAVNAQPR
jgi:hypothetical protein